MTMTTANGELWREITWVEKKHLGRFSDKIEAAKAVYWYKAWLLATYGEEYSYTGPCCSNEEEESKNNVKTS